MENSLWSLPDIELIDRILQDGDKAAFHVLYERYKVHLANYVKSLHYQIADEDIVDIVQETFVVVYTKLKSLKNKESFKNWLFVIARNETNRVYRKNKKIYYTDNMEFFEAADETNKDPQVSKIITQALHEFIESIKKDRRRSVFYFSVIEHKRYQDIADMLGLTLRMVKYEMKKAKESFAKFLKKKKIDISIFI